MEIAPNRRRGRGLYKLLTGVQFRDGVDLRRQMVEAGKCGGTAEERLNEYYGYVNGKQKDLLRQFISERQSSNEGILVVGLLRSVVSE